MNFNNNEPESIEEILKSAGVDEDRLKSVMRIVDSLERKLADEPELECAVYVSMRCPHHRQFIDCCDCVAADAFGALQKEVSL